MSADHESLITVIGRGNSGTRIIAHALYSSGVFMGPAVNPSGDTIPPEPMYHACRLVARHVKWRGGLSWDFSDLHTMQIDPDFIDRVEAYLEPVLRSWHWRGKVAAPPKNWYRPRRGWKLPETTLAYPWVVRLFPDVKYIHVVRDPRDCLLSGHTTDDLSQFAVPYPPSDDVLDRRVASWKYQHEIVKATPKPTHFISIRYEDLVQEHDATMRQLEGFLGFDLPRLVVDPTRIGKWKADSRHLPQLAPLERDMRECGYGGG